MVRVIKEDKEFEIRCTDCLHLLAYKLEDIEDVYDYDYTGSRDYLGKGITCPVCRERLVIGHKKEVRHENH
jgi:DNA-directed RNA polymerase subunit RPC12/RpoP